MKIDWQYRKDYIESRSKRYSGQVDIRVQWADEAVNDSFAIFLSPDPASESGISDRTIGFSKSAGFIITVITVMDKETRYGVNAWKSNNIDVKRYERNKNSE